MSTDVRATARAIARGDRRRQDRYRRTVLVVVGALTLATAGLGVAGSLQGPKLDEAVLDAGMATERSGARLVLDFDQPLAPDAEVTVQPQTAVESTVEGNRVTVTFDAPLAFETGYEVRAEVTGAATGRDGSAVHGFETPRPVVTTLVRDPEGDDRVERRELRSDEPEVLFQASVIQEYALLDDAVAAVVQDEDARGSVRIAPFGETSSYEVPLPTPGTITRLDAARGLLAFAVTSDPGADGQPADSSVLHIFDTADPSGVARTIPGLDGAPLQVTALQFVPGTSSLVVQTFDTALLLVDPISGTPPSPLGQHAEVRGFLPGTTTLVVADPTSGSIIDLADGATELLELPEADLEAGVYESDLVVLDPERYVEVVARPASADEPFRLEFAVVAVDADGTRVLFEPATEGAAVRELCVSPNGQYAAITVDDPGSEPDGVPNAPSFTGASTRIVSIADASTAGAVPGFAIDWCR